MGLGFNCEPIETNSKVIMFKNGMRLADLQKRMEFDA